MLLTFCEKKFHMSTCHSVVAKSKHRHQQNTRENGFHRAMALYVDRDGFHVNNAVCDCGFQFAILVMLQEKPEERQARNWNGTEQRHVVMRKQTKNLHYKLPEN